MAVPQGTPYPLGSNDVGLSKPQVRVIATSNITLSGAQTIDGVAVIAGDRVLVAGQTTGADNGIYVCAAGAWSRADDFSASIQVKSGLTVVVNEGTLHAGTLWVLTTSDPITLGSTALVFQQPPPVLQMFALGNTTQNSSTSLDARSLSFNGLGIVTVGFSNGSIQVSATAAAATQSNQTVGLFAVGNTTQASSTTLDARTISLNGLGAATVGFSNGSVQVSVPVQTNQSVGLFAIGNTTQNSSTTLDARSISFNGLGGATMGYSNGSVQVSVPVQTNQTIGAYAVGNTTGQSSSTTVDARSFSFDGAGIASVGMSGGSVVVSVPSPAAQTVQTQNVVVPSAGSQTATSGTVAWANSNGISFGMSGSSQITASYTVPTVPAQLSVGVSTGGNTSGDTGLFTGRVVLAGGNNITISGSSNAGSVTLSISAPNAVAQTVQTQNVVVPSAGTQTATSGTVIFSNSNGISFGMSNSSVVTASYTVPTVPAQFSGGLSNVGNTSGDTVVVTGRLVLAGGNNITVSGSSNAGSMTITISAPNAVAQTNQTLGLFAVGNTTQNSSTTLDARTVSFDGLGGATVGFSNGSVQVSAPAVSSLQGAGGLVVTTTGSTISVSGWNITNFEPYPPATSTTNYPNAIGTWYLEPFYLPANMSGGRINRIMSFGSTAAILRASSADFQTGTTGTRAVTFNYANTAALYTLGAGTNSTRLDSMWSNTFGITIQSSCSVSSAVNVLRVTCGATMSVITSIDSAGSYTTSTMGSTTSFSTTATSIGSTNATQYVSSMVNMLSGSIIMPVGLNSTLAPGNYWLGQAWSTSSTTSGTSGDVLSYNSQFGLSIPIIETANSLRQWLQTASTTNSQFYPGHGVYSAAVSSPPATIAFSDVRSFASGIRQYFNFVNSTLS